MTETLFERYKEALRAGHVAAVRGRLEEAVAAYREAGAIAPDRAVPRTALGAACLRLGDPEAALEAYDAALVIAPDDDAATIGRAQALVVLRRTADAAAAYDRLADIRAAGERPGAAAEAARRALAIEPTDARRARHADLVEVLRATAGCAVAAGAALDAGSPIDQDAVAAMSAEGDAEAKAGALGGPDPEELVAVLEDAIVPRRHGRRRRRRAGRRADVPSPRPPRRGLRRLLPGDRGPAGRRGAPPPPRRHGRRSGVE